MYCKKTHTYIHTLQQQTKKVHILRGFLRERQGVHGVCRVSERPRGRAATLGPALARSCLGRVPSHGVQRSLGAGDEPGNFCGILHFHVQHVLTRTKVEGWVSSSDGQAHIIQYVNFSVWGWDGLYYCLSFCIFYCVRVCVMIPQVFFFFLYSIACVFFVVLTSTTQSGAY